MSVSAGGLMNLGTVVFDRYRLEQLIGAGGMGTVWRATDQLLNQPVALKRVPFTGVEPDADRSRDRALREARVAAQLRYHPHVVSLFDVLVDDANVWLVMEYLPARSLSELLRTHGRLSPEQVARIGAHVADALAAGHARGIEHRDVKPGNVLISADGAVKLTDFGIAHLAGDTRLTQTGIISGTVPYLAPEVAGTGLSSPASDVFSLGSTLYAAVEGQPPFGSDDNIVKLLNIVRTGIIRPPRHAGSLEPLLLRLLQVEPAIRPDAATARDLLTRFATAGTSSPAYPPPGPAVAASAATTSSAAPMPPARRRRTAGQRIAITAAVLLTATAATAGAVIGVNAFTGPPAAPGPPATTGPVALTGDPRAADPCELIDRTALNQFGRPRIAQASWLESCQARIEAPNGGEIYLDVIFEEPASSLSDLDGTRRQAADFTIFEQGFVPDSNVAGEGVCRNILVLTDLTTVYVDAFTYDTEPLDLCAVTRVATDAAVQELQRDGITYTPERTAAYSHAGSDACTTLDLTTLSAVPGLDPNVRLPGFANWSCYWGESTEGHTYISLQFILDEAQVSNWGTPTAIAGKRAFIESSSGIYNAERCKAYVVHRSAPTVTSATEMFSLSVDGPLPAERLCELATHLATAIAGQLPTT